MRKTLLAAAVLVSMASVARAQQGKPVELGLDATLSYSTDSPHATSLVAPLQRFRIGFAISPSLTLEPTGAFDYFHTSSAHFTDLVVGTGLLYHFNTNRSAVQPYVRPFVEFARSSSSLGASSSNASVGAGLGVKIPVTDRFKWRLEGGFAAANHRDSRAFILAGFSIFTH